MKVEKPGSFTNETGSVFLTKFINIGLVAVVKVKWVPSYPSI